MKREENWKEALNEIPLKHVSNFKCLFFINISVMSNFFQVQLNQIYIELIDVIEVHNLSVVMSLAVEYHNIKYTSSFQKPINSTGLSINSRLEIILIKSTATIVPSTAHV